MLESFIIIYTYALVAVRDFMEMSEDAEVFLLLLLEGLMVLAVLFVMVRVIKMYCKLFKNRN